MANKYDNVEKRMEFNAAEKYFEYDMHKNKLKYIKYGLDKSFPKLSRFVRNTPDYIVKDNSPYFVEVKSGYTEFSMKDDDFKQYSKWNKKMSLFYYFFSYRYEKGKLVSHQNVELLRHTAETGYHKCDFGGPDKPYFEIKWSLI